MKKWIAVLVLAFMLAMGCASASANTELFSHIVLNPETLDLSHFDEVETYTVVSAPHTFQVGQYTISRVTVGDVYTNATPNVFTYTTTEGKLVAVVVSQKQYTTLSMRLMYQKTKDLAFSAFEAMAEGETKKETIVHTAETGFHDGEIAAIYVKDAVPSMQALPFKTCDDYFEKLPDDILSDQETASMLYQYADTYSFGDIVKLCNKYLKENEEVSEADHVHSILETAKECQKMAKKCKIKYDKYDDQYSITYGDIKDVSKSISICTYYDGTFVSKLGFRENNWVFFDTVDIAADDMERIHLYFGYQTERDSAGSGVKEYALYNFTREQVEKLHNAKNPSRSIS